MPKDDESEERGFKVQDRRRFTATGDTREAEADEPQPQQRTTPLDAATPDAARQPDAPHAAPGKGAQAQPEINFATFVLSLSTQALAHLGEIPDPTDDQTRIDLAAARQLIDILAMLDEKTKGNLDDTEADLIEHALYDLRMKFVERSQRR